MDNEQQPNHLPLKTTSNAAMDDQMEAASEDHSKSVARPVIGMEFSSMEEERSYYEAYAGQQGFWIKQRSSKKRRNRIDADDDEDKEDMDCTEDDDNDDD